MLKLALRNLFRHYDRTLLTLVAIVIGVAGLVLGGGFVADIFVQLQEASIHSTIGHAQVYRAGYYAQGKRESATHMIESSADLLPRVRVVPGVTDVLRRVYFSGLANNGRADLPVIGDGVEPVGEAKLGSYLQIVAGRNLVAGDDYAVVLGQGLAKALGVAPGDYVTLLVNTVAGAMNTLEFKVVGVFRSISQDYDARALRIPLATAQVLLDSTAVHSLVLVLHDTAQTDAVVAAVARELGKGYEVLPWYRLAEFYQKTVELYQRQFLVLLIIVLALVSLGVANSVTMSLHERTGEFGTLKALGTRNGELFRLILVENALLGFLGGVCGVLAGVVLAWAISAVGIAMPPPPNMNIGYTAIIRVVPWMLVLAFGVGWLATLLAAILPARRAARQPIVEALRANL